MQATAATTMILTAASRMRREEEESMSSFTSTELKGYEFKIVRTHLNQFKDAQSIDQLLTEEKQAGWELFEKLDDSRLRLKKKDQSSRK